MALVNAAPIPYRDPMVTLPPELGRQAEGRIPYGLPTRSWIEFLSGLQRASTASSNVVASVTVPNKTETLGATDISGGQLPEGLYRCSYYEIITIASGGTSSLTFGLTWTENSITKFWEGTAMTGNTNDTTFSQSYLFYTDKQSPVRIQAVYASTGTPIMEYKLRVVLERMGE
jgi:hypothetical protein